MRRDRVGEWMARGVAVGIVLLLTLGATWALSSLLSVLVVGLAQQERLDLVDGLAAVALLLLVVQLVELLIEIAARVCGAAPRRAGRGA